MTTFDDREKAFENRFAHDQELFFRAEARRNHDVALWAAGLLGRRGEEAENYAAAVLAVALEAGGEAVIGKLRQDFAAADVHVSEHQIRNHMDIELAKALERLRSE